MTSLAQKALALRITLPMLKSWNSFVISTEKLLHLVRRSALMASTVQYLYMSTTLRGSSLCSPIGLSFVIRACAKRYSSSVRYLQKPQMLGYIPVTMEVSMRTIIALVALGFVAVVGCNPQPVVVQPASENKTVIIERGGHRHPNCPPAQPQPPVIVVPPSRPVCPPPQRPGVNIEIDINKPQSHCSPSHRCGKCDYCRRNGIKIEINR